MGTTVLPIYQLRSFGLLHLPDDVADRLQYRAGLTLCDDGHTIEISPISNKNAVMTGEIITGTILIPYELLEEAGIGRFATITAVGDGYYVLSDAGNPVGGQAHPNDAPMQMLSKWLCYYFGEEGEESDEESYFREMSRLRNCFVLLQHPGNMYDSFEEHERWVEERMIFGIISRIWWRSYPSL